jgi:hypothetical protein
MMGERFFISAYSYNLLTVKVKVCAKNGFLDGEIGCRAVAKHSCIKCQTEPVQVVVEVVSEFKLLQKF